jgi:nitroreductase
VELDEAIRGRRSIRKYEKGAVIPPGDLEAILEAAIWAPSSTNVQPWRFIVVTAPELISQMAQAVFDKFQELSLQAYEAGEKRVAAFCRFMRSYGGFFGEASAVIIACAVRYDISRFGLDEYMLMAKIEELGGPSLEAMVIRTVEKSVAMAVQNLLLKAHQLGYGTCVMDSPLVIEEDLRQMLHIPSHYQLVMVIPIGVPAQKPEPSERMGVEEVTRYISSKGGENG